MGRVVRVGRRDGKGQGNAVGGVGGEVHFVAEAPLCFALFGPGTVFNAPSGIAVFDYFAVGIGVALKESGVYGGYSAEGR